MSATTGAEWITLEQAEEEGLRLAYVRAAIGPRRTGTLYYGAYWGDVNNVIAVHVKVGTVRNRHGRMVRAAVHWQITERSVGETRVRRHCTSWDYDRRNYVLYGPADTRV